MESHRPNAWQEQHAYHTDACWGTHETHRPPEQSDGGFITFIHRKPQQVGLTWNRMEWNGIECLTSSHNWEISMSFCLLVNL